MLGGGATASPAQPMLMAGGFARGGRAMGGTGNALHLGRHGHGHATHLPHVHLGGKAAVHGEGWPMRAEGHAWHALLPWPGLHEAVRPWGHVHPKWGHGMASRIDLHALQCAASLI